MISSTLSVSPSSSSPENESSDMGDGNHKHIKIELNSSNPDSLGEEEEIPSSPLRIMSVYLKEPTLQIERAYTPLYDVFTGAENLTGAVLDLIIKRYQDGELSRYAHRLRPSLKGNKMDEIANLAYVRGPVETWSWKGKAEEPPEEIVLVSLKEIIEKPIYCSSF